MRFVASDHPIVTKMSPTKRRTTTAAADAALASARGLRSKRQALDDAATATALRRFRTSKDALRRMDALLPNRRRPPPPPPQPPPSQQLQKLPPDDLELDNSEIRQCCIANISELIFQDCLYIHRRG